MNRRHYANPAVIAGRMSCDIWPDQMQTLAGCRRISKFRWDSCKVCKGYAQYQYTLRAAVEAYLKHICQFVHFYQCSADADFSKNSQ